jgi:hypothetical protein
MLSELNVKDSALVDELLDEALVAEPLALYFPFLQASVITNTSSMIRLSKSLELGKVPIRAYSSVLLGNAIDVVPAAEIANFIMQISRKPEGEEAALNLLNMQFHSDRRAKRPHSSDIVTAGRELLRNIEFDRKYRREDFHLGGVVEVCVRGDEGYNIAKALCERLKQSVANRHTYGYDYSHLLQGLLKVQPRATLDALLVGDSAALDAGRRVIGEAGYRQPNPMNAVSEEMLIDWCNEDPGIRFPVAASVISAFIDSTDGNPANWTPISFKLVHSSPEPIAVLRALIARVRPMVWSDSRSAILEENGNLLDQFDTQGNATLAAFLVIQKELLQREARAALERETKLDKERDERFE